MPRADDVHAAVDPSVRRIRAELDRLSEELEGVLNRSVDRPEPEAPEGEREGPCPGCAKGEHPVYIDADGTLCSVSGRPGRLGHGVDDYWWYCDQYTEPAPEEDDDVFRPYEADVEGTGVVTETEERPAMDPEPAPPEQTEGDPSVLQDDLRELMEVLGISTHARPVSPHRVMQEEVIPAVRARLSPAPTESEPTVEDALAHVETAISESMPDHSAGQVRQRVRLALRQVRQGDAPSRAEPMRRVSREEWDELRATLIKGMDMTGDAWRNVDWIMAKMRLAVGIEIEGEAPTSEETPDG